MKKGWIILLAILGIMLLGAFVVFLRMRSAPQRAAEINYQPLEVIGDIGTTTTLEILPLFEANSLRSDVINGHGVSYLIRTDEATILMDVGIDQTKTGDSPLVQNMRVLDVSFDEVDTLVISHKHADHLGGQSWFFKSSFSPNKQQPDLSGMDIFVPVELTYPGQTPVVASQPRKLAEGVVSLGTLAYAESFPNGLFTPLGYEQTLAVHVAGRGIVLISGCGHPGMAAIIERAGLVFHEPVVGVVGGYHFTSQTAGELEDEIALLQESGIELIALSPHDSFSTALSAFEEAFPEVNQSLMTGFPVRFDSDKSGAN